MIKSFYGSISYASILYVLLFKLIKFNKSPFPANGSIIFIISFGIIIFYNI